ncbi:PepSY domain-containing protein [Verrucomicrobium sp. BvORR034]|uniref:PepSY-associated TM helix domain-containing protein n=1 Tax=Verrucomicrobium sp. BvORR034 TaxID=1396418 RepID=UPI000678BD81|nr:PepSY domain-containing protein [Verrucomicrobium sp. BvORR034]
MRKQIWRLHSWLGLLAGLGLLVIGLTGSILVFSSEIDAVLNPALVRVKPAGSRMSFDSLKARVLEQLPGWEINRWYLSSNPEAADTVRVSARDHAADLPTFVNPYTGQVLGKRDWGQGLVGWLLELHYSFHAGAWGVVVVGACAALLLASSLTGIYLYRDFWRHFLRLRWKASMRLFCSDLHKAIGITSLAFNLILGLTGAWWNLQSVPYLWKPEPPAAPLPVPQTGPLTSLDTAMVTA